MTPETEALVNAVVERRIRTVALSPGWLVDLCKTGHHIDATCIEGLPDDARLWECSYSAQRALILLDVAAPSFEPVAVGQGYPEVAVTFKRGTP